MKRIANIATFVLCGTGSDPDTGTGMDGLA